MATASNNGVFIWSAIQGKPFGEIWDAQIWQADYWIIPKNGSQKNLAFDFVKFATGAEPLAAQASYISHGPARFSSQALVGNHYELGIDMKPEIPTSPQNFSNALAKDHDFWAANRNRLGARFSSWIAE